MIPEVSSVDNHTDQQTSGRPDYASKAGEAIAQAICEHFGKPFVPPHSPHPGTVSPSSSLLAPPRRAATRSPPTCWPARTAPTPQPM